MQIIADPGEVNKEDCAPKRDVIVSQVQLSLADLPELVSAGATVQITDSVCCQFRAGLMRQIPGYININWV